MCIIYKSNAFLMCGICSIKKQNKKTTQVENGIEKLTKPSKFLAVFQNIFEIIFLLLY